MIINGIEIFWGEQRCDHQELQALLGAETADKIAGKSGFFNRYITKPQTDIFDIARRATRETSVAAMLNEADLVIVVSEYVKNLVPPPSALILGERISDRQLVIDLNRGCSGFCEALVIAHHLFLGGQIKKAVIITAENYSKMISRSNRTLSPIFSDAVAFTSIEHSCDHVFHANHGYDYVRSRDLAYNTEQQELNMNGAGLVSFVRSKVLPKLEQLVEQNSAFSSVEHLFVHQGSQLVIDAINKQLAGKLPKAKFLSGEIGNINSSSIPYVIKSTFCEDNSPIPLKVLLSGFGVGLSFCNVFLDMVYKNDYC